MCVAAQVCVVCVQDELLIFMEYCNEGTLEKVCAEMMHIDLVRRYTRFLILGLLHLHKHNVVHRDIKRMHPFLLC